MNRGTHLTLGDTGRAEDRVVRIVNLHYEPGIDDVHKFFGGEFTIIDFVRGINPKTNKNTVGYVLFATEQEHINAQTLSGRQLLNREVKVLPAQRGFCISPSGDRLLLSTASKTAAPTEGYETLDASPQGRAYAGSRGHHGVDEHGFVPSSSEHVITYSSRRADTVANNITGASFTTKTFVREGLQKIPKSTPSTENTDFQTLLGQLGMVDHGRQQTPIKTYTQHQQGAEAADEADDGHQARKTKLTWGLSRDELTKRYLDQQRTLLPMPSGIESPGQVFFGPPVTPPVERSSPSTRHIGSAPRGPRSGIDTSFYPREYNWSLSGIWDPARDLISEEAWYEAHQQFRGNQKQSVSSTSRYNTADGDVEYRETVVNNGTKYSYMASGVRCSVS